MRLDKFLKVSRLIKRRTVANEAATPEESPSTANRPSFRRCEGRGHSGDWFWHQSGKSGSAECSGDRPERRCKGNVSVPVNISPVSLIYFIKSIYREGFMEEKQIEMKRHTR